MTSIIRLKDDESFEFFAPGSLLPVATKCNLRIVRLEAIAEVNVRNRTVKWKKKYSLQKVNQAHDGFDQWFEVTGCPEGECLGATENEAGFAFSAIRDDRGNLTYRVDFGRSLEIGEGIEFELVFIARHLEKEDKLLQIGESTPFYRSFFLRYDQGYAVGCDSFVLSVKTVGGRIAGAWPRALTTGLEKTQVTFEKQDLRPYEVVTPLVHLESGSSRLMFTLRELLTFGLGVAASILATLVI